MLQSMHKTKKLLLHPFDISLKVGPVNIEDVAPACDLASELVSPPGVTGSSLTNERPGRDLS